MLHKINLRRVILVVLLVLLSLSIVACKELPPDDSPTYSINDDEKNQANKDQNTKETAIEKVTTSITNLKERLNSEKVGEGGYYLGFDFFINTAKNDNFILKLQAHLFTYPYMNEFGVIREDDLAKHNELIKKSTILLEWYDGRTNTMLIGFYFDGVKSNPHDPGNILYLNLQGEKRWFPDFGDTVLFQQMIRLITSFSIDDLLNKAGIGEDGGVSAIETLLDMAITNNYKVVVNHDEESNKDITSIRFDNVSLDMISEDLTEILQSIFSPFSNKIDPLTKKYLGFRFSTLGRTSIRKLNTNLQFFTEPDTDGLEDILTGAYVEMDGTAYVDSQSVPFTSVVNIYYGVAPPEPIQLDREYYKYFDYGKYEFTGNLYLPTMNLQMDALIRMKINEFDNTTNHVFSEFRDIANGDLLIGAYYKNELAYFDIEGLQHLYGGIKIDDIGFPKVFIEDWDLAKMLGSFKDMVDKAIISIVDNILDPLDRPKNNMLQVIMAKMESTERKDGDPLTVRNTVMIRIDHELLKDVLREGGYGTYTTRDIINIINAQLPITLDELCTILGITSAEILLEKTWIKLTLDVDTNMLTIQLYSDIGINVGEQPSKLLMQLDLIPVKIGEDMIIAEISFDNFKELLPIYTYSAEMGGQFIFSNAEVVDLSELLSSFMDDISGLNTPYILPAETKLDFTLVYDQYIKEQYLQTVPGGPRDGRWTKASRNAFILNVFIKGTTPEDNITLFNIYANDVSFKTNAPEEDLGYIWVDLVCLRSNPDVPTIPKFKIREDYWLQSVNRYLNSTKASDNVQPILNPDISLSITTIISALMEDSYVVFQPEQIEITTSNETVQSIFGVESLIGTINAQIGLVQRVFGVDQIEDEFAEYSVGYFEDIYADGPYTTKLHETIDVTFTFNQNGRIWSETLPLRFKYEPKSVEVKEDPTIREYHPIIYGPILVSETSPLIHRFMGVQRGYTIYMTGGQNSRLKLRELANDDWYDPEEKRIITKEEIANYSESEKAYFESIKHKLLPHYRLEPRLPKPTEMELYAGGTGSSVIVTYEANILIDWESVTLAGGEYFTEVIIAEGMMGETVFPLHIVVTNRVVDTSNMNPQYVNVTANPDSDELTEAPVVDRISIDPYDYLWQKAIYFEQYFNHRVFDTPQSKEIARQQTNIAFIQYYFRNFDIAIRFVDFDVDVEDYRDTPAHRVNDLVWYFDRYEPTKYYKETDIVLSGGSTYLHADFKGQIVALQVVVESRTIRGVYFDGEEENNVYTVDMLDSDSYAIPLFPLIIFEEKDEGDRHITRRLIDADNGIEVPMLWSHPIVNNPRIEGTDTPFLGSASNLTSSYVDLYRALGVGEWIFKDYSPIVVIRVECPSKEIADLELPQPVYGYKNIDDWHSGITSEIKPSYINIGDDPTGFYYVDPFNPQTAKIPGHITVTFKGRLGHHDYYTKDYNVVWDTSSGLVRYDSQGDYYMLTVNSEEETYLQLTAMVGNEQVGYIEIVLCVKILTSHYTDINFFDDQGNKIDIGGTPEAGYVYYVNTYQGFKIPHSFAALFGESDVRYYNADWKGKNIYGEYVIDLKDIQFKPGSVIELKTTLPGAEGAVLEVRLTIDVNNVNIEKIIFTNIPMWKNLQGQLVKLPITLRLQDLNDLTLDGIRLNTEGKVENLYFGRGFYTYEEYEQAGVDVPYIEGIKDEWGNYIQLPVEPVSLYPYELLSILFLNTCLIFDDGSKMIKDYDIHNLRGIMDTQDIVQKVGDTANFNYGGGKYVVRLGQGQGAHDLTIRIRFTYGLFVEAGGQSESYDIELYNPDGTAIWGPEGFVLADNVSASIEVSVQETGNMVTYLYGPLHGQDAPRLDIWYVENSNVPSIPIGSYISYIPREILYDSSQNIVLELSFLTEKGFRIKRSFNIVKVSFLNMYRSIDTYDDIFTIENGRIVIKDLYKFYPLALYLNNADNLPKIINRHTSYYDITISDVQWTISQEWRDFLAIYDYKGDAADILLATAEILGWYEVVTVNGVPRRVYHNTEKIYLYIHIESAEVKYLPLEESHNLKSGYKDILVTSQSEYEQKLRVQQLFGVNADSEDFAYREFVIYMDAYRNSNYKGSFVPPANLVVGYADPETVHTFSALKYYYQGYEITTIPYGITGIICQSDLNGDYLVINNRKVYFISGDDRYNMTLKVELGAGQTIAVRIHFFNKTVKAVRPIIEYGDEEIRQQISQALASEMEKIQLAAQENINIKKLEHEITAVLIKNREIKETVNKNYIYAELKKISADNLNNGSALERVRQLLDIAVTIFENPGVDETDKRNHNYAAHIVIEMREALFDDAVNAVYGALEAYLRNQAGATFGDIEQAVTSYLDDLFNNAGVKIINNKIIDFAEPQIRYQIEQMEFEQRIYVVRLKNQIQYELNVQNILNQMQKITLSQLTPIRLAIEDIINAEFIRMIEAVKEKSDDSQAFETAVENKLKDRMLVRSVELTDLCIELARIHIGEITDDPESLIKAFFEEFFHFIEDDMDMIIMAIKEQIEKTSAILVAEMRASYDAGLAINTGGRLTRAVNLSIAETINNIMLEGRIVDAIRRAQNLNEAYTSNGQYAIDPYGDYIFVPTRAEIIFDEENGGESYIVNINWTKPSHWSTPRNPNAGVTYAGNEAKEIEAQNDTWVWYQNELERRKLEVFETGGHLTIEEELLDNIMQSILNAIYTERLQNGALTKDQGWAELWNDAGISHAHLNSILSSIEKRYPSDDQTQKHIYCFDMWVYIEAWNQLRGYTVPDDPDTAANEYEIWQALLVKLARKLLAIRRDEFTAKLYTEGVGEQDLSLIVLVHKRRLDAGSYILYKDGYECSPTDPMYHIEDPFAGRVSDFPNLISVDDGVIVDGKVISFSNLTVDWDYTDQAITYAGTLVKNETTGLMGVIVKGYIKNSDVGQEVRLRLVVNSWEYNDSGVSGLRQYTGPADGDIYDENNYTIMDPISFVFSKLVDYSAQEQYQVMIKETCYKPSYDDNGNLVEETEVVYRNVLFYPEDSLKVRDSIDDAEMAVIKQRRNYILYWDAEAKSLAYNSGGTPVLGSFSLGNARKNKLTRSNRAYYQYEESYISKVNPIDCTLEDLRDWLLESGRAADHAEATAMAEQKMKELYNITGVSSLVINPLNPVLPATVDAKGILNQVNDTQLNGIRVLWNKSYGKAVQDLTQFVKYMYPTLTNNEADRSAKEILMDIGRSAAQEQELIENLIAWLMDTWSAQNLTPLTDMDNENWEIYYHHASTTSAIRTKMSNIMDRVVNQNGNRTSVYDKNEGWYKMYTFLDLLNSIEILTEEEKAMLWDFRVSGAADPLPLQDMYQRIAQANQGLDTQKLKALAFDEYVKWENWYTLKLRYTGYTRLINETNSLYDYFVVQYPGLNDYEYGAKCWDHYVSTFGNEDLGYLNTLRDLAQSRHPEYAGQDDMLNAIAWDEWIKATSFREWMTRQAKNTLMIDEEYDIHSSTGYLDGGIDGTKTVTLLLQLTQGGYIYAQTFKIRLIFLDLSSLACYADTAGNNRVSAMPKDNPLTEMTIAVKADYFTDDYVGRLNPYNTTNAFVFDLLDYFATREFMGQTVNKYIDGAQKKVKLIRITNIVWNIPANAQSGDTVYSDSFTVGEITYKSDLLKMVLS